MRLQRVPRAVRDIRTASSMPGGARPGREQGAYARPGQLARERYHLLEEQELWQRKLGRITRRLTEIDSQMERLNRQVPSAHDEQKPRPPRRLWQEIEFPY
jgi:hypothetical protein